MLEDMQEYSQKEKTEDNLKSYLEQSNQFFGSGRKNICFYIIDNE